MHKLYANFARLREVLFDGGYVSASKEVDDCSCILCYRVIEKAHERYLVAGKSKFNAKEAI